MYKKTCISSAKLLKVNSGWPGIETVALVGPCLSFLRETCDFACLHSVLTTPTCFVVKRRVEFTQMYLEPMQEYVCKFRLLALSLFCVQGVIPVARLSILTHPSETLPVRKGRFPQPNRQLFGNRYSCLNLLFVRLVFIARDKNGIFFVGYENIYFQIFCHVTQSMFLIPFLSFSRNMRTFCRF